MSILVMVMGLILLPGAAAADEEDEAFLVPAFDITASTKKSATLKFEPQLQYAPGPGGIQVGLGPSLSLSTASGVGRITGAEPLAGGLAWGVTASATKLRRFDNAELARFVTGFDAISERAAAACEKAVKCPGVSSEGGREPWVEVAIVGDGAQRLARDEVEARVVGTDHGLKRVALTGDATALLQAVAQLEDADVAVAGVSWHGTPSLVRARLDTSVDTTEAAVLDLADLTMDGSPVSLPLWRIVSPSPGRFVAEWVAPTDDTRQHSALVQIHERASDWGWVVRELEAVDARKPPSTRSTGRTPQGDEDEAWCTRRSKDDYYPWSVDIDELCPEGLEVWKQTRNALARQHLLLGNRWPVWRLAAGARATGEEFEYRTVDDGVVSEEQSDTHTTTRVGVTFQWIPHSEKREPLAIAADPAGENDDGAAPPQWAYTLELHASWERSWKASSDSIRWCNPVGELQGNADIDVQQCEDALLGAPTQGDRGVLAAQFGAVPRFHDRLRAAVGLRYTASLSEGGLQGNLHLDLPLYLRFSGEWKKRTGFGGVLRIVPTVRLPRFEEGDRSGLEPAVVFTVYGERSLFGGPFEWL